MKLNDIINFAGNLDIKHTRILMEYYGEYLNEINKVCASAGNRNPYDYFSCDNLYEYRTPEEIIKIFNKLKECDFCAGSLTLAVYTELLKNRTADDQIKIIDFAKQNNFQQDLCNELCAIGIIIDEDVDSQIEKIKERFDKEVNAMFNTFVSSATDSHSLIELFLKFKGKYLRDEINLSDVYVPKYVPVDKE